MGKIECSSKEELKDRVRSWRGEDVYLNYFPTGIGWKFRTSVRLGHRYSYYAYVEYKLYGVHPNSSANLSRREFNQSVSGSTPQEVADKVLDLLR